MRLSRGWGLALACCLILFSLGCNARAGSAGGSGGSGGGGLGGCGGNEAINACLDLQNCCRAILVNPVFFEACNGLVLQCDEARCNAVLAGYPQCATVPDGGVGGAGGSADPQ